MLSVDHSDQTVEGETWYAHGVYKCYIYIPSSQAPHSILRYTLPTANGMLWFPRLLFEPLWDMQPLAESNVHAEIRSVWQLCSF